MKKAEAARLVDMIIAYYPRNELKPQTVDTWIERLTTIPRDYEWLKAKVTHFLEVRAERAFFPSLAEIMGELKGEVQYEERMRRPVEEPVKPMTDEERAKANAAFAEIRKTLEGIGNE